MVTKHFLKVDYDLLYKKIQFKSGINGIDLFGLLKALEILSVRLKHPRNIALNMEPSKDAFDLFLEWLLLSFK